MAADCERTRNYLHGHLDHEIDPMVAGEIEAHVAGCTDCAGIQATLAHLQGSIRRGTTYHRAPAALRASIARQLATPAFGAQSAAPGAGRFSARLMQWWPTGLAVAASVLVTAGLTLRLADPGGEALLGDQVIAGHARAALNGRLTEVASTNQHTVKPWLSARLDFSPRANDLAAVGFPLHGARLDYVDARPVAVLVYGHRLHTIDLYAWPDARQWDAAIKVMHQQGFNLLRWHRAGITYWALSYLNETDLNRFAQAYAATQ